jgi:nitrite reductase (NO-forming)
MYHCGTAPVAMHIAKGMYKALIVDSAKPLPPAREFVLVQSEFYLGGTVGPDSARIHPIDVGPDELLRLYVVNAGPNRISSFHVVGGIFERVFEGASHANPLMGVQTVNVPVEGGAIFELRLREPGDYPCVTHAFADATKGGVASGARWRRDRNRPSREWR